MLITYKYRIFPSQSQIQNLTIHFGHNRYVWNEALRFIRDENNGRYTSLEKCVEDYPKLKNKSNGYPMRIHKPFKLQSKD